MRLFAVQTRDDESCQLVIPHDHGHKEVYNALIMRTETNRKPRFFLQNLPKPTDSKIFETVTTLVTVSLSRTVFGSELVSLGPTKHRLF